MGSDRQDATATSATREYGRNAGLLSVGVGLTGLLIYVYFALASRALEAADYGEIAVLWSATFILVATLHRPVEQLVSRTVAERRARGQDAADAVRVALRIQGVVASLVLAALLAAAGPVRDRLLDGSTGLYWVLVIAVCAYAASYLARGYLAGSGRIGSYAALLITESTTRVAFALAVTLGVASGQLAVAAGIAAAPLVSLLVAGLIARRERVGLGAEPADAQDGPRFGLGDGTRFASFVLVIMVSEQVLLGAGVLFARAEAGVVAAALTFNILLVARAPVQLFQAVSTSLLPHLTRLHTRGDADRALGHAVAVTICGAGAFALLAAAALALAGPSLMGLAFGEGLEYPRTELVIVAVGAGVYLAAATLNQAALAIGRARHAAIAWAVAALAFLLWCGLADVEVVRRVAIGFAAAAALALALLARVYLARPGRAELELEPGSARELEARLAAADEAS